MQSALEEAWELTPERAVYVVDERHRKSANTKTGWKNCNLLTTFTKIIGRAGLQPWQKLYHAMRSSRATELAQQFPIHVVTAWLGNTRSIALRHYLLTKNDEFDRAANPHESSKDSPINPTNDAVQKAVQKGAEMARNASKRQVKKSRNTKENGRLR